MSSGSLAWTPTSPTSSGSETWDGSRGRWGKKPRISGGVEEGEKAKARSAGENELETSEKEMIEGQRYTMISLVVKVLCGAPDFLLFYHLKLISHKN